MQLTTSTPSSRRVDAGAEGAAALAERLGHSFADLSLLQHALAHRSWCGEQEGGAPSNERLEFLGDAVLGLIVAGYTFERYPDFAEGKLAKVRSAVVNARVLAQVAGRLGVGEVLLLGRGEEGSGGRAKASILADAFEAILGAIYLDAGWDASPRRWSCASSARPSSGRARSPTTSTTRAVCRRRPCATGRGRPATWWWAPAPTTTASTWPRSSWAGRRWGSGEGRSKKDAEQEAARAAWEGLTSA